jgi:catechol 2,3-dioxygenase-like lactoylglutathione lyase family enzyme
MASRIGEIIVDCSDPDLAARFWCAALGYRVTDREEAGVDIAGDSRVPTITFLASTDKKLHKNRLHLDIYPVDTTQDAEIRRLEQLGAKRIDIGQGNASWVVMEDPVGNEFCVMSATLPPEPQPFHHLDIDA